MRFTLTLKEEQHERLIERSATTGMPVAEQMRRAVDRWLDVGMAEWAAGQVARAVAKAPSRGRKK